MAADLTAVAKRLPPELRVRASGDADIERVVEFQNRWATPSQWMAPASARLMMTAMPDPLRLTLLVEDRGDELQAVGLTSSGGMFASPDGSWRVGLRVAPQWSYRGGHLRPFALSSLTFPQVDSVVKLELRWQKLTTPSSF